MTPTFPLPWHGLWPALFWLLMAIAASLILLHQPSLALAAVRSRHSLTRRIGHILDPRPRQPLPGRRWTTLATLLAGATAAGWALAQSRTVSATDKGSLEKKPPPAAPAARAAEPPVALTGQVVDRDGKPLAEADVAVIAWPTLSAGYVSGTLLGAESIGRTKTNKEGRFRLNVARPAHADDAAIVARATGTGPAWSVVKFQNPKADVVIRLQPQQVHRLRLIDLQGQPAAGVKVYVARLGKATWRWKLDGHEFNGYDGGDATGLSWLRTFTQPEPRAKAEPLPAWPVPVTTDKDGRLTLQGVGRDQGIGLLVRDDRFALQVLDIKPPQSNEKTEELTLTLAPPRLVEGKITDSESGKPVPQARLHVTTNCIACHAVPFPLFAGTGGADWKGRRGFAHELSFPSSIFLGVDGGADANGKFWLNPF